MSIRLPVLFAASGLLVAGASASLSPAVASASIPTNIVVHGHCSGTSVDNLQIQRQDSGKLSIDFGVDMRTHTKGLVWRVTETDNGASFVSTKVRTIGDGSFSITRNIVPQPGPNTIVGTATSARTGETCALSASI